MRVGQALDDLATLAERARRDPDPVEEVRERLDALLVQIEALNLTAREVIDGGAELTEEARRVTTVAREIVLGGEDLTRNARILHVDTRELIEGGERLTASTEQMEAHMRVFRAALPRLLDGIETVEELEDAVETVADTVEPLQGAAERVGRVTQRFSRSS